MPDHLHALVEGRPDHADVTTLARQFMQVTTCAYNTHARQPLWQPRHHERTLRDEEASDTVARHILENPIRAGLTHAPGEYPFAFSDVYDLQRLLPPAGVRVSRFRARARAASSTRPR